MKRVIAGLILVVLVLGFSYIASADEASTVEMLGFCFDYRGVTYHSSANTTTLHYTVRACDNPPADLSNWGLKLCTDHQVVTASPNPWEVVDSDSHYGFRAIKWDVQVDKENTAGIGFEFTINGQPQIGETQLGGKAGQQVFPPPMTTIEGPVCPPTAVELSKLSATSGYSFESTPWNVIGVVGAMILLAIYAIYMFRYYPH